jgi:hypothetical protein
LCLLADAAYAGAVDCASYDYSTRWWISTSIKLRFYQQKTEANSLAKELDTLLAQMASGKYESAQALTAISRTIENWESNVAPWLRSASAEAFTHERLQAIWYLNYAPEALNG